MKLISKMILLLSTVVLIGGGAVVYFVYNSSIKALEKEITDNLEDSAFHTMDKIETAVFTRYMDMKNIAAGTVISSKSSTPEQITRRLKVLQNRGIIYLSLSFFNLNRIRIADTTGQLIGVQHRQEDFWVPISEGKDFTVNIHYSESLHKLVFHFVSVVKDKNGVPFGVIVSRMPLDEIYSIVEKTGASNRDKEPLEIDLVDGNGLTLYSNNNPKRILNEVSHDWEYLKKYISEGNEVGSVLHTYLRDTHITAFASEQGHLDFKGNDWTLIVCLPTKIAFAPAVQMRNKSTTTARGGGLNI